MDESKQVAITIDNGSNIKRGCQLLAWPNLSCFSHNLDLAINKGLSDAQINHAFYLCRKIVASFSYSGNENENYDLHKSKTSSPKEIES